MDYYFIGERELLLAFRLVGVRGTVAVNKNEAFDVFMNVTGRAVHSSVAEISIPRPRVLIITEEVATWLEEEIFEWQLKGDYPLIVEVPGIHGKMEGKKSLTEQIREAIGIRV